jgi:hypothetical protein
MNLGVLEQAWDEADVGSDHVITRYRTKNANLRTQLERIIKRAGLKSWPKLFHNLRATRQTELAESFPAHVVCAWMGNSQAVAARHYLQVTDEHFADALEPTDKAAQNPAQSAHASARQTSQANSTAHKETPVLQGGASDCDYLPIRPVPERGLEPPLPFRNMVLNHARLPIPPLGRALRGIR